MKKKLIREIISQTQKNYNIIASHFSQKRKFLWPQLKKIEDYLPKNGQVLDLGCGNGRLYQLVKRRTRNYLGIDFSEKLLKEAKKKYPQVKFQKADITQKSFWKKRKSLFDAVLLIAVLHHIPSKRRRMDLIEKIYQALKPGGVLILTVWNLWQRRFWPSHLQYFLLKLLGKSGLDWKDIYYPYQTEKKAVIRYLHSFTPGELKKLIEKRGLKIKKNDFSSHNFLIIAQKDSLC